jgi:CheY-like chemotaxis protein
MTPVNSILVVDDDAAILSSLAEVLRDEGYLVKTAANGYQALALLEDLEPDVILLDLRMPHMNGWTFLTQLRGRRHATQPAVVLVSSRSDLPAEAARLGVEGFLRKPFDLEAVVRITGDCCRLPRQAPDEARPGAPR